MSWEKLVEEIHACRKCPSLIGNQAHPVEGDGPVVRDGYVILGEALGEQEAKELRPFVGRAGQCLREALKRSGLPPELTYITNICKCRPPENRDPTAEETAQCRPWLERQLQILQPRLIITLGKVATGVLQEKPPRSIPIMRISGTRYRAGRYTCLAVFHPSFVLRRGKDRDLMNVFIGHFKLAQGVYKDLEGET